MKCAARSATITVGAFVLPETMQGNTEGIGHIKAFDAMNLQRRVHDCLVVDTILLVLVG